MGIERLLVANRGEIAIRVMRAAAELGIETRAIYPDDDAASLHTRRADAATRLEGAGAAAYLDIARVVSAALETACDAVHPGYGFLSESAEFARAVEAAGLVFVGPTPETLALFGDKTAARELAERLGVPVAPGTSQATSLEQARAFFEALPAGRSMLIKAVAGGGGRGMRVVEDASHLDAAYERCQSEARAAFGTGDVYVEELMPRARHIEVQVVGDAAGNVVHLWERECSIQRRHQKLVEFAPAPGLDPSVRDALTGAALSIATEARYRSLGTVEFLVDASEGADGGYAFIETNARLQVEHTVTEAVTGVDLVQAQLRLAGGESLADLKLDAERVPEPHGFAIQTRVNMETMALDGSTRPAGGTITAFDAPSGLGVRTDSCGYSGYATNPRYDSLLAKVIGHSASSDFEDAVERTYRALSEMRVEGVATNIVLLQSLLRHPDVRGGRIYTRFLEDHLAELLEGDAAHRRLFFEKQPAPAAGRGLAGAKVDSVDPLAVLDYGKTGTPTSAAVAAEPVAAVASEGPPGTVPVAAPMQGTIVSVLVAEGDRVRRGQELIVMEAMKMEHVISSELSGYVREVAVSEGDTVYEGHPLIFIEEAAVEEDADAEEAVIDLDEIRPDLATVHARHAVTLDEARPDAVAKRRATRQRTARENVDDLCDAGTFREYGSLVLTPGTGLPQEDVIKRFPTDGMITGIGAVNGELFDAETARCVVMAYDYTVLAGTQGPVNHPKTDRMLELAAAWLRPVIFFAEGGGGRAGTGGRRPGGRSTTPIRRDVNTARPLQTPTFATMGRLSGLVPLVGITSGRCFAGNASLLGCCDVIIATANSNIGMGGPALVEGGNLGVFTPEEIGPMDVQVPSGVVDIAVEDEAEAVAVAKRYVAYFQGPTQHWEEHDQRLLRRIVPENRLRIYDVREVIETLADVGSVLELRRGFGLGMVTSLIRIEGEPLGVIANNPSYLAGAIDSDGSDKAARFMQLCDAFDIPILVLCDTPGMMVGPEIEKTALVRHCSRLFVTGANLTVPHMTIVLRKAYGLGAQAMAGGSFSEPMFAVAWPTGEFGGMGLEGQVKLGFRNELAAMQDPAQRAQRYEQLVAAAYERGQAINYGVSFGVDDVIDPADSRQWIHDGLNSRPRPPKRTGKKRRNIDTW